MKKIFIIMIIIFCLIVPTILADGMIHISDNDMWYLFEENEQYCAINYKAGFQKMILTVDTTEELRGDKAVWIFPVPSTPDNIDINILNSFPSLHGSDLIDNYKNKIEGVYMTNSLTQIYGFFNYIFRGSGGRMYDTLGKDLENMQGVDVHKSIQSSGLTTELVTATNSDALVNYLNSKNLTLEQKSKQILQEYLNQEYSFVISWISDIEQYKIEQEKARNETEHYYYRGYEHNNLGVFIKFPTKKIFYPLKPTSVYEEKIVPTTIYVTNFVVPELYKNIKSKTNVKYFRSYNERINKDLLEFFDGHRIKTYQNSRNETHYFVKNIDYTKIKIEAHSNELTEDLWMQVKIPAKIKFINFINKNLFVIGLFFFIFCSIIASFISGLIIFKKSPISKTKLALFGLFNFLTLIGLTIATYFLKTKEKIVHETKNYIKQHGNEIFKNQKKQIANYILIFLGLTAVSLILIKEDFLSLIISMISIPIILIFIFKLSNKKIKNEYKKYFTNNEIKIVDLRSITFFAISNILLGILLVGPILEDRAIRQFFDYNEFSLFFCIILSIFIISLIIYVFIEKRLRMKSTEHLVIMHKDFKNKFLFILLFTIIFSVLNYLFMLLLTSVV